MPQSFVPNWYDLTFNADQGFTNAENNDNTLRSSFSGPGAPSSPVEGQFWYDTDTEVVKLRTQAEWRMVFIGDSQSKIWFYRNDATPGWLIDTSVSDVVLALRGGNYGSTGGALGGNWTISGLSIPTGGEHPHRWKNWDAGQVRDETWDSNGQITSLNRSDQQRDGLTTQVREGDGFAINEDLFTETSGSHNHPISVGSSWRPRAAVGTMQYPNLA